MRPRRYGLGGRRGLAPGALCPEAADPFCELATVLEVPPDAPGPFESAERRRTSIAATIAGPPGVWLG